jgi:acetyl-CoA carboxylase carboxyl transferase subunit alpha
MAFERPIQELEDKLAELEAISLRTNMDLASEVEALRRRLSETIDTTYAGLSPWQRVVRRRATTSGRPALDFVEKMLDEFVELHGDKVFGDDRAIVTGLARMGERRFLLVAHRKGARRRSAWPTTSAARTPRATARRCARCAWPRRSRLPIVCLINTPGAYPGIGAEERGQAAAIAENILADVLDPRADLVVVIGEGGSGGALGIGVGDRVCMLEHAYYSVISPRAAPRSCGRTARRRPTRPTRSS